MWAITMIFGDVCFAPLSCCASAFSFRAHIVRGIAHPVAREGLDARGPKCVAILRAHDGYPIDLRSSVSSYLQVCCHRGVKYASPSVPNTRRPAAPETHSTVLHPRAMQFMVGHCGSTFSPAPAHAASLAKHRIVHSPLHVERHVAAHSSASGFSAANLRHQGPPRRRIRSRRIARSVKRNRP